MFDVLKMQQQLSEHALSRSLRMKILRGLGRDDVCGRSMYEALARVIGAELSAEELTSQLGVMDRRADSRGLAELAEQLAAKLCQPVH